MEIKEPVVEKSTFNLLTSIWIVPIIAVIIGLWLVYDHFSKLGPKIEIEFKNSGGLVAGQSVVKFRDVPVGKVIDIRINDKKEGVIVTAQMNKEVKPFLNENTKFWIVKPEVDYSGVRGLDTLFSGSYIAMYAIKKGKSQRYFKGSSKPFLQITDDKYYALKSNFALNVKRGTPIYFKSIRIGEVDNVDLNQNTKELIIIVRIYKEYDYLVNISSRFWIKSLLNLNLNDNRLDVHVAPLPTLLLGGIELNSKFDKKYPKAYNKIFRLYRNKYEAKRNTIKYIQPIYKNVLFEFKGDISSIEVGMAIKYKGIRVGEIDKIDIKYNALSKSFEALCLGFIDISNFGKSKQEAKSNFNTLLENNISAKLEKKLLFNKSDIVLQLNTANEKVAFNKKFNAYKIPTLKLENKGIIAQISSLISKLKSLNVSKSIKKVDLLIDNINSVVKKTGKTIDTLNKVVSQKSLLKIGDNLNKTLIELRKTLKQTQNFLQSYGANSLFKAKIDETLKELHDSAQKTERLLHKLNKKPNAIIFGE